MADKYGMKQTIKNHPYALFLLGFFSMVGWGLIKLAAMLETMQG